MSGSESSPFFSVSLNNHSLSSSRGALEYSAKGFHETDPADLVSCTAIVAEFDVFLPALRTLTSPVLNFCLFDCYIIFLEVRIKLSGVRWISWRLIGLLEGQKCLIDNTLDLMTSIDGSVLGKLNALLQRTNILTASCRWIYSC